MNFVFVLFLVEHRQKFILWRLGSKEAGISLLCSMCLNIALLSLKHLNYWVTEKKCNQQQQDQVRPWNSHVSKWAECSWRALERPCSDGTNRSAAVRTQVPQTSKIKAEMSPPCEGSPISCVDICDQWRLGDRIPALLRLPALFRRSLKCKRVHQRSFTAPQGWLQINH